ncbi:amino acid ABC transporter substrate-binding protein [Pseudaminobacter arsenicus]|uniref:Amino acid ABC transporter substrate-binding protein n=1 Tax=Borborobacter arsenicus TaxID=1851146 RepID=A0A432VAJ4_9HYPH|nr:ABC transporter substrate-binding protein [Pseudaminobacter arsenicus]RUM99207.1 amino acid ABC transporter substrate-binding protein [Pseudaminobacter arsenicus]
MSRLTKMALMASVLACSVAGAAADTIKIGINQPLTGSVAASGNFITDGAKLAAEAINEKGGVLGKQLELVIEDNKSNPSEAAAAAEKLISRDEVSAMMGAWGSSFTLAVMPKLQEYGIPMVVETASSSKVTSAGNPWVFRIAPTSEMEAKAFGQLVPEFAMKKVDFLVVNNDWGLGAAGEFGKMLKEQGVEVGMTETMDPAAQDVSAQLAKIKASDADTLFVTTGYEQLSLVFKQLKALDVNRRVITTGGSQFPDRLAEQLGSAADNSYHILFFAPWFPDAAANPEVAHGYIDQWNQKGYDKSGLSDGFRGYDAITAIAAAVEAAGSADPEAIRDALWKVDVKGVNGNIKFQKVGVEGSESGQSSPNVYVVEIKDGKLALP